MLPTSAENRYEITTNDDLFIHGQMIDQRSMVPGYEWVYNEAMTGPPHYAGPSSIRLNSRFVLFILSEETKYQ